MYEYNSQVWTCGMLQSEILRLEKFMESLLPFLRVATARI